MSRLTLEPRKTENITECSAIEHLYSSIQDIYLAIIGYMMINVISANNIITLVETIHSSWKSRQW